MSYAAPARFASLPRVALALVDQVPTANIIQFPEKLAVLTADSPIIRWIGDRKGIEQKTKTSNKIIINRERETQTWVPYVRQFLRRSGAVYGHQALAPSFGEPTLKRHDC
jgi:hypothetical protein